MGTKFCPNCRGVVITRALPNYSQIEFRGIMVKRREIIHREEDLSASVLAQAGREHRAQLHPE